MSFVKGTSGNPNGRPKGATNKTTAQLRLFILDFLDKNFNVIEKDFSELNPKERVKFYLDLLQYGLPKLQAVQLETDFDRLPEEQLDTIIETLKKQMAI
jgi:hypothetical protein